MVAADWTPKKLDVTVDLPDELDLEALRGHGLKAGEEELPDSGGAGSEPAAAPAGPLQPDESVVQELMVMGFSENACKRAAVAMNNAPAETTMSWIFEHMEEPDFNDPLPAPAPAAGAPTAGAEADPEVLMLLTSMGFKDAHAKASLRACDNNGDRAAEWLFSHADDMDAAVAALDSAAAAAPAADAAAAPAAAAAATLDGPAKYSLVGFITHLGKRTDSGHYVCHIKKDDRWLIFNDKNVAVSEVAPRGHGYMYLYKRNA
jgi:ubiquitin carboxyl-terminal hydrolase 5/13